MSTAKLVGAMALYVLVGAPLVWLIWEGVNALLSGRPGDLQPLVFFPALALFLGLLTVVSRAVHRWDAGP